VKEMGEIALPSSTNFRGGRGSDPRRMFATSWQRSGRSLVCHRPKPEQTLRRVGKNRW